MSKTTSPRPFFQRSLHHRYKIIETLTAGIVLTGWETRSVFAHQFDLKDSYAIITNRFHCYLLNFHLTPVEKNPRFKPQLRHKLLLTTAQIRLWNSKKEQNNYTIIPLQLLLISGKIKVVIALAGGLKNAKPKPRRLSVRGKRELDTALKKLRGLDF